MTSAMDMPVKRVVLIVAMEQEADPFIRQHNLRQMVPSPFMTGMQMVCYSGTIGNGSVSVFLVWTGRDQRYKVNNVATTAASVATYASLLAFSPVDLVLSAGTAGGFAAVGGAVGDVYLSTKCVFHNRRIPLGKHSYEEYGFGHFRSPSLSLLASRCGLKQGVISTSDSLDHSPIDMELMRGEGAAVKEMEAAAVAWVCQQVTPAIPFVAVKSITDIVDSGIETVDDEFYANLKMASEALQQKLTLILQCLSSAPLSHWSGVAAEAAAATIPGVPQTAVVDSVTTRVVEAGTVSMDKTPPINTNNNNDDNSKRFMTALPLLAAAGIGVLCGVSSTLLTRHPRPSR